MKKNAFTLIELLAVIILIGLLAVLIIPKINDTVSDARKNTNEVSTNALARTATNYYLEKKGFTNNISDCTYDFTNNINTCAGLEFTGKKPESGKLVIKKNGNVALSVKFDKYCYIKRYNKDEIEIIDNNNTQCEEIENVFVNYEIPTLAISGDGLYEAIGEPGRYVYRGATPNNYINIKEDGINNTLYRIISYEPDGTIKVVRNESIGNMSWDKNNSRTSNGTNNTYCTSTNGCNVWGNQTDTFFQGETLGDNFHYSYYLDNSTTTLTSGGTGKVQMSSTLNKYLNDKTSTSWQPAITLDNYIDNHAFNVGGIFYKSSYTGGDKGLQKEKQEERLYTWNGKIGLMNVTEYVEASLNQECTSAYSNYFYNGKYYYKDEGSSTATIHVPATGWPCKKTNWTFKNYDEWTISPYSYSRAYVWDITAQGSFSNNNGNTLNTEQAVRPSFYLKANIILSGQGTEQNPYNIVNE